jgi:hypothetical protein
MMPFEKFPVSAKKKKTRNCMSVIVEGENIEIVRTEYGDDLAPEAIL